MFAITNPIKSFFNLGFPDLTTHRSAPVTSIEVDNGTEDGALLTSTDIQDVQVNYMSKADLAKLIRPMPGAYVNDDFKLENYPVVVRQLEKFKQRNPVNTVKRPEIIDTLSYMPKPTECLRARVVTLLRLLEDDIRTIENTRGLDMVKSKNPLNDLVMRDHKALYKTLKEIKAKGGQVLKEFHDAIDNLGYWGGYKRDERVIRIHHPNLPYGYIEV